MAPMEPRRDNQKKRKFQDGDGDHTKRNGKSKKLKTLDARTIPTQSSEAALSKTGELDVASFVAAREYEVKALESSLANSKKELRLRAFQQVPRNMRRRTASHNVKRLPKKLRSRAAREMKEDSTPTVTKKKRAKSVRLRLRIAGMKRTKRKVADAKAKRNSEKPSDTQNTENDAAGPRVPKIKKNVLSQPPSAVSRFKRRQINKTWLPTHIWHAKRAHMTKPKEPLWRMAIPLSPTEKSYRPTHRAASLRGCIAWDASYVATIGAIGMESSLKSLLKSIGFGILPGGGEGPCWGRQGSKWVAGTRHENGWAQGSDKGKHPIGPITVIWCCGTLEFLSETLWKDQTSVLNLSKLESTTATDQMTKPKQKLPKRQLFIRAHPSIFLQLWSELTKQAKAQKPAVMLEDLRFEIGSIELTGAGSTECLLGTLRPAMSEMTNSSPSTLTETFTALSALTNPASLPRNALIAFETCDPRLHHPAKTISVPPADDLEAQAYLAEMLAQWPLDSDSRPSTIFSQARRVAASQSLSSQKAITRRKTLAPPGERSAPRKTDPQIPVMLMATNVDSRDVQGSWTFLLPWKCVDAIWRCLMYYPISSGGQPRFGGLDETRQVAFERGQAWFPGDFPETQAGKAWQQMETENRQKAWERKPPRRRIDFKTLDLKSTDGQKGELGNPWDCDWNFLFGTMDSANIVRNTGDREVANIGCDALRSDGANPESKNRVIAKSSSSIMGQQPSGLQGDTERTLLTVKVTLLTRGTPLPCARIYRLPSATLDSKLRREWLGLDQTPSKSFSSTKARQSGNKLPTLPKDKLNWRGDVRKHEVYGNERKELKELNARFQGPESKSPDGNREGVARNSKSTSAMRRSKLKEAKVPEHHQVKKHNMRSGEILTKPTGQASEDDPSSRQPSRAQLIQSLLKPTACEKPTHPQIPSKNDLIGYVTSGNYNLAEGRGTGFGSLWNQKLYQGWSQDESLDAQHQPTERQKRLVIIRNAGETVGRLAIWELLS